jgi:hypothetical protein
MNSEVWIVDGTFSSDPVKFYQLVTIHAYILGKSFPAFYISMKNKKEKSYEEAFNYIKSNFGNIPKVIITDFEIGLYNTLSNVFTNARSFYCFFHFAQAIHRKLQEMGLGKEYKLNGEFKILIKKYYICLQRP